jgi:hypothetical protein
MIRAASFFLVALTLAACGSYRPLYGPSAGGQNVTSSIASVSVPEEKSRTGQLIRNEIIAGLTPELAKYQLKMKITEATATVSATPGTVVLRKRFNLSVDYVLVALESDDQLTKGKSFANVSYDTVREPVADIQAAEAARSRAATQVGQDLRQRLAAYFATQKAN